MLCFVLSSRNVVPSAGQLIQSAVGLSKLLWVVSNLPWVEIFFCPTKYVLSKPTGCHGSHFLEPWCWNFSRLKNYEVLETSDVSSLKFWTYFFQVFVFLIPSFPILKLWAELILTIFSLLFVLKISSCLLQPSTIIETLSHNLGD